MPCPPRPTVYPGGRLEARALTFVRGFGRFLGDRRQLNIQAGTTVRVQLGGVFSATGMFGCMDRLDRLGGRTKRGWACVR